MNHKTTKKLKEKILKEQESYRPTTIKRVIVDKSIANVRLNGQIIGQMKSVKIKEKVKPLFEVNKPASAPGFKSF